MIPSYMRLLSTHFIMIVVDSIKAIKSSHIMCLNRRTTVPTKCIFNFLNKHQRELTLFTFSNMLIGGFTTLFKNTFDKFLVLSQLRLLI